MKFMEWNIHGKGNYNNLYKMPTKIITNAVGEKNPDVAVFLEYIEKTKCPLKQWLIFCFFRVYRKNKMSA